jgi:hypothetical protein
MNNSDWFWYILMQQLNKPKLRQAPMDPTQQAMNEERLKLVRGDNPWGDMALGVAAPFMNQAMNMAPTGAAFVSDAFKGQPFAPGANKSPLEGLFGPGGGGPSTTSPNTDPQATQFGGGPVSSSDAYRGPDVNHTPQAQVDDIGVAGKIHGLETMAYSGGGSPIPQSEQGGTRVVNPDGTITWYNSQGQQVNSVGRPQTPGKEGAEGTGPGSSIIRQFISSNGVAEATKKYGQQAVQSAMRMVAENPMKAFMVGLASPAGPVGGVLALIASLSFRQATRPTGTDPGDAIQSGLNSGNNFPTTAPVNPYDPFAGFNLTFGGRK